MDIFVQIFNPEISNSNFVFFLSSFHPAGTYLIYLYKDDISFSYIRKKLEQPKCALGWFNGRLFHFL